MSLTFDARRTALILIDLQQGILAMKLAPHSADRVVDKSLSLIEAVRAQRGIVCLVHVDFGSGDALYPSRDVDAPSAMPQGGIPPEWSRFSPRLDTAKADMIIVKRNWGAFYGTDLDLQLRRRGVDTIILGGVSTNFGVEQTAREAWQHNYKVVITEDACSSMAADMHQFSIEKILPRVSRVSTSEKIIAALQ